MSADALKWAERQKIAGPASLKSCLRAVAWALNAKSGACFPSQQTIADRSGLSERSVRRALFILEELGVLVRQTRSRGRMGRTSDAFVLATHREFDVSRKDLERIIGLSKPQESHSSNRPKTSFQPANLSGDRKRNPKLSHPGSDHFSTVSGCGSDVGRHERGGPARRQRNRSPFVVVAGGRR